MFRFMPETAWHNGRGWDFQIWRLASQAHYGGGHLNEIARTIEKLISDDGNSWYREWHGIGDELSQLAAEALKGGHHKTGADRLFRASNYYRMADFFLKIDDDRKLVTARKSVAAFLGGVRQSGRPVEPVRVPYEDTTLKGYWCRPIDDAAAPRAIVLIGGLDSTAEELYFTVYGLIERGFHILIIEGPGQGTVLREQKLTSRFDYEVVGTAAYDWVRARPEMVKAPIALIGMSLGGYYSLRIACFEHRFSALVSWSPIENYGEFWKDRPDNHNLAPHVQWVLGASSMAQAREIMSRFDVARHVDKIVCPTLLCVAEHDGSPLSLQQSKSVFEKLKCPKTWHYFSEQTGGSLHCQQDHLTLANEVIGDWLDETLTSNR
jgi:esterase/lipase